MTFTAVETSLRSDNRYSPTDVLPDESWAMFSRRLLILKKNNKNLDTRPALTYFYT
jgi:hypothetical protein